MNTTFLLMAEFGSADVPLEVIAEKYLGLGKLKAYDRANFNELPFPTYRAGSTKSTRMVRITELAEYLDNKYAEAKREWSKTNVA
jgi:hypothetical protein